MPTILYSAVCLTIPVISASVSAIEISISLAFSAEINCPVPPEKVSDQRKVEENNRTTYWDMRQVRWKDLKRLVVEVEKKNVLVL